MKDDVMKVQIQKGNIIIETAKLPAGTILTFQPTQDKRMLIIPFIVNEESGEIIKEEPKDVSFSEPFKFDNKFAKAIIVGYVGLIYEKKKPLIKRVKGLFSAESLERIYYLVEILSKLKTW